MRFLNGMWQVQEGVQILRAREAYEIEIQSDCIRILAPAAEIRTRGHTLNQPALELMLSSPCNDVISVDVAHFRGTVKKGPEHEIRRSPADIRITETDSEVIFRSGDTSARIRKSGAFHIAYYYQEQLLTSTGDNLTGPAFIWDENGDPHMREMLNLSVGETVYGLGERFGPFVKNGQQVELWAEDGGTCTPIAYKNVPLYLSNRNYGVFVNYTGKVSYEIATEVVSKVQFSVSEQQMQYMVIGGGNLHQVMRAYTGLTGKPAIPPAWSFGLWLTTSFTTNYDEDTVTSFIDGMAERNLPLHVFHYDCFWMREFHWCDFTFDRRMFPEPKAMLSRLKEKGLKICLWINPYIAQRSVLFDEAASKGFLLKKPNGDVWQCDLWQAGMACVDFTHPGAVAWYQDKLQELIDTGADCFKTDFGERIPTDVAYYDGSDPHRMHNYYTHLYNKTVFELLERNFGKGNAALFARSGIAGGQQFPVHWGGDCSGSYESMAETLRGGLSLSMSGYSFWSHDISGFESTATPDLYKRWCAFGLLSTHSRLHGSNSYRVPWNFDDEAVDVLRFFTNLKCRLMPYLFSEACRSHKTGIPVMRAMAMDYTGDKACAYLDCQYKLGDSLIVAPVLNETGTADFYLPEGLWTNLLDGEQLAGGHWYTRKYGYKNLGLFAAENAVLPTGAADSKPDYDYLRDIRYHLYAVTEGASFGFEVYDCEQNAAETVKVDCTGGQITVTVANAPYGWGVCYQGTETCAQAGCRSIVIPAGNV